MEKIFHKAGSLLLSAVILWSLALQPALAAEELRPPAEELRPPAEVVSCQAESSFFSSSVTLTFPEDAENWLHAITGLTVNGTAYAKVDSASSLTWSSSPSWFAGSIMDAYGSYDGLQMTKEFDGDATVMIAARGYEDLTISLTGSGTSYTAEIQTDEKEPETYAITVERADYGTVTANPVQDVEAGTTVTVTAAADSGYTLEALYVTGSGGTAVETVQEASGIYTFIMPAGDVTVSAAFQKQKEETEKVLPSCVVHCETGSFPDAFYLGFGPEAEDWLDAIDSVTVNGISVSRGTISFWSSGALWDVGDHMGAYETYKALQITKNAADSFPAEIVVSARGYEQLVLTLSKTGSGYNEVYTAEIGGGTLEPEPEPELKTISLEQISISTDYSGNDWYVTFENAGAYVSVISSLSVNGTEWEETSYGPYSGGAYRLDASENRLILVRQSYGSAEALKSGDIVEIKAEGYRDLTFQFVVAPDGTVSLQEPGSQGDPYQLHLKLDGTFEAAIVGQTDYDGVSGATGSVSSNQNSQVTVYGALLETGQEPGENDWAELESWASGINIDSSKTSVSIVPDTEKGTPADSDSGMHGVYFVISSSLTLSGTPRDPGAYLISITAADDQGRTATSNALPFRIYTGEETLAEQLRTENLTQTQDGKYMWDIMEPWAIKNFGSNAEGEENSVRVPAGVKAWYGSHTSGTYGYLGYDIPWTDVENGDIPQTLYIPAGCDLTLVNMEILSSVRIVVEDGGKLTLQDSVVQGIIDVQGGGAFSMNYNGFGENPGFMTGASLCGQLRLEDGAILENAAIYSHINYLANGDLADRTSSAPVVTASGNVTVRGQVFIQGDEAGDGRIGQTGLCVQNGTLTLEDGAVLVVYGGGAKVQLYPTSGTAIQLDNGTITGNGKVVAVAGQAFWGDGGTAVTGTGSISAAQAFLQGATAYEAHHAAPGKAIDGTISVSSPSRHVGDGTLIGTLDEDPLEELYWKTGIEPVPPLEKFTTRTVSTYTVALAPNIAEKAITISDSSAEEGTSILLRPGAGYQLNTVTAQTAEGDPVTVMGTEGGYVFTMPAADVIVFADYEAITYEIAYSLDGGTNASGNPGTYTVESGAITIQEPSKENFEFSGWTWPGVTEPVKEAVIPAGSTGNRSYTAHWREMSSSVPTLSISASPAFLNGGGNVSLTVTGTSGGVQMICDETIILSESGNIWTATLPNRTAVYTFTAKDGSGAEAMCTVSVTYSGSSSSGGNGSGSSGTRAPIVEINDPDTPLAVLPAVFTDVETGAYYSEAVQWAVENDITSGTSAATFSPDAVCTRAQAVTFLWRTAGTPAPQNSENPFSDVQSGTYYYDAVLWAVEQGITVGTSATTFSPDSTVTRAQVVTFLYRLSGSPAVEGADTFTDVETGAFYAEAVQWAVKNGITSGTSTETFSPNAECTRAQILTFLFRSRADKT